MMPPFRGTFIPAMIDPSYLEGLKRRKEVFERLCAAARDYLCLDLDEAIARAENPPRFPQMAFNPEMLINAIQKRDQIQGQLDSLETFTADLPEAQADFLRKMQGPMLEQQLKDAENWISTVQKHLEADSVASTEPSDPAAALGDPSTGSNSCDQKAQEDQK